MGGGRGCYAGSPLTFQCRACCRVKLWDKPEDPSNQRGRVNRVKLTGRKRKYTPGRTHMRGQRTGSHSLQYECGDCGHVGWSAHTDLESYGK